MALYVGCSISKTLMLGHQSECKVFKLHKVISEILEKLYGEEITEKLYNFKHIFSAEISCQNAVISSPSDCSEISEITLCSVYACKVPGT